MKKDQKVFTIIGLEIKEGIFIIETLSHCHILIPEGNSVTFVEKKWVFETKDLALEALANFLKEKLRNVTLWETRVKDSILLLEKLEKISEEFDLKKKEVKK